MKKNILLKSSQRGILQIRFELKVRYERIVSRALIRSYSVLTYITFCDGYNFKSLFLLRHN